MQPACMCVYLPHPLGVVRTMAFSEIAKSTKTSLSTSFVYTGTEEERANGRVSSSKTLQGIMLTGNGLWKGRDWVAIFLF